MSQESNLPATTPVSALDATATPPFSMTDEESDIASFHAYLRTLTPDALWDVRSHLDADLYPRRFEAVGREIARRRVFYVTPYTEQEAKLRQLFLWSVLFAALAAALHAIGRIPIDLEPWEKLSFFYDLAAGGPKAARMVLPLERTIATVGEGAVLIGIAVAGARCALHRFSREVLLTGVGAFVLGVALLALAYR